MDEAQPERAGAFGEAARHVDRDSRNAALTLALALPGDTLLYLLLPLYAASFGVTLSEAGLLLAANRLIRIVGYSWVARLYAERGPRAACTLAAVGAMFSTFAYAALSGIWLLLVGRLVWGLAFAALNIANHALPTTIMEGAAIRAGRVRAIIAAGPTAGLIGGAILAYYFGPRVPFVLLAAVSCLAPIFAMRITADRELATPVGPRFEWPGPISTWSFSMGLTLDGLFVFGLSLLAAASYPDGAVLAAGLAMSLRYAAEVALSATGGVIGNRFGVARAAVVMSLMASLALALLGAAGAWLWTGVIAAVLLRALIQPLVAPLVAEAHPGPARIPALARQATWRDIGAGAGPLLGGFLLSAASPTLIYLSAAGILAIASLPLNPKLDRRPSSRR